MATRSAIGVMHGSVIKAVYCHWDGYLEGVGSTLVHHYNSAKANHLVALGDVSSLGSEIGEKHNFNMTRNGTETDRWTTFYGRDRGEENVSWKVFQTYNEFVEHFDKSWCEYFYIMKDGEWYYSTSDNHELRLVQQDLKEAA